LAATIQYYGTGKRKTAVARAFLRPGQGAFKINKQELDQYFRNASLVGTARSALVVTDTSTKFDVTCNVRGGGKAGQADAVRHGVSRALLGYNAELRLKLKEAGFLTRDSRIKERKKYGQPGARKRFQFSKR
jgi:small subunit ribosomal protein S9